MLLFHLLCLPRALAVLTGLGSVKQRPLQSPHEYDPLASHDFEAFINRTLDEFLTPGVAIAVVHGNKTFSKGYGYANIHTHDPVTPRTLFQAGSTTKSFTAATMSKLVYSNESAYAEISWTTKLADLIRDDFVLHDEYATTHITLADALSHRTGMPRHDLVWTISDPTLKEQVRQLRYVPLSHEIRTEWQYCNLMFSAVSLAIETVTGTAMGTLLREWIWQPLGMHETFYSTSETLAFTEQSDQVNMARGYLYDNYTKVQVEVPYSDLPPANGAGGVISNVLDYIRWIRMFLHPSSSSNPISASAIKTMTSAHMLMAPEWRPSTGADFYALGLIGSVYRGHELLGHNGAINGYMTDMQWVPELDWGVVIMQNAYSLAAEIVLWRLLDDFLLTPEGERFDMAGTARQVQAKKIEQLESAREILYPEADVSAAVGPALPLSAYEGLYHHPGYKGLRLSKSREPDGAALPGAPLPLYANPATRSYLNISATLHHVSGEHWWAQVQSGPGSWLADEVMRARFEIGANGKVKGLGLQAEPAMAELAWFEKVE
ncbi:hypothetical protein LTR36_002820 [Oleoguttula mirabilis]|uniref:Beta-lactamase-related domain-containing protein n=1 Tax=Oleoguttula mirabilis TaxID=1507867 RepID=A0AAV9JJP0_9PEZI|nr:hypothetical protein LTR36_002820 [Oleoguttula mirabilis]